jgi:hypothetical protein
MTASAPGNNAQSGDGLPVIHMFWHGAALSRVERLCMASFLANGHALQLHVYDEPAGVPGGVQLVDAAATLSRQLIFHHERSGSIAAFADWFRYRLLYDRGGVWADTDVVCLKPVAYARPEVFARQDEDVINNAILGLPAQHPLAAWMSESCEYPNRILPYDPSRVRRRKLKRRLLQGNRRGNIQWGEYGPYGFTAAARHLGYEGLALPFWHFYPVPYQNWRCLFDGSLAENPGLVAGSVAIHLWNEMTRRAPNFDRNGRFPADSLFEQLYARYVTTDR